MSTPDDPDLWLVRRRVMPYVGLVCLICLAMAVLLVAGDFFGWTR